MRLEKHEIHRRIKSDLKIEFAPQQISSYSGNVAGRLLTLATGKTLRLNECQPRQKIYSGITEALTELAAA